VIKLKDFMYNSTYFYRNTDHTVVLPLRPPHLHIQSYSQINRYQRNLNRLLRFRVIYLSTNFATIRCKIRKFRCDLRPRDNTQKSIHVVSWELDFSKMLARICNCNLLRSLVMETFCLVWAAHKICGNQLNKSILNF